MALKALPTAFISRVCETAQRVPFFTARHLTELSLHDAPKPDILKEPRLWASARSRAVRAALEAPLADGRLDSVPVNLGKLFPVTSHFYCSTPSDPEMDAATVAERLNGRPVDRNLHDVTHIVYGLSRNPAAGGSKEELREFFYGLSFIENKALAQLTGIYLHLLCNEPAVADTYRFNFHRHAPASFVEFDDILKKKKYREKLGRHLIPGNPETSSAVYIDRGSGPVRVLYFVRPIPADALIEIKQKFDEASQHFELW